MSMKNLNWGGLWQSRKAHYYISKPISKTSLKKLLDEGEKQRIVIRRNAYRHGNEKTPVFQFTFAETNEAITIATEELPHSRWNPEEGDEEERKYTHEEVMTCIHGACRDGQNGYDPYDLMIEDYI